MLLCAENRDIPVCKRLRDYIEALNILDSAKINLEEIEDFKG